jgi:hypothetical protein
MGNIVKLANVGGTATWHIAGCETVAGKFGAQVKFTNDNGDQMFLSQDTADRQLDRCGLTTATAVGETLVFFRSENAKGGAPYWNIKVAGAADKAPPSKRLSYTEAAKPASGPSKGSIPEMDDFPSEEYGASIHAPDSPYDEPGPIPPFHKPRSASQGADIPNRAPSVAPNAEKKAAYINAYFDLLGYVRANSGLKDEVAIQAATATLHIGLKQEGLR